MSRRITHARSVASVIAGLCLAAVITNCAPQDDDPPGNVDQPGPQSGGDARAQGALLAAPSKAPRTIAAMMFDIGSGPPNAATIMSVIGGTGTSQRHMFQEISYGIQDTQPMYFGPYTLPVHNCLTIACCGPSSDQTGNGATVQKEVDALGMTFNHYFWVYGGIPSGANCGTWGDEGSPSRIATYSSYSFHQIVGYAQEIGHNFGMTHEPIMCCGGTVSNNRTCNGGVTFSDNTATCQHLEYGNSLSFMGSGAHHPSALHKYQQGWLSGCNLVKAGTSTTLTMVPQELPCGGVQLVQIPAPKTRPGPGIAGDRQGSAPMLTHYYLEMRAPYGFDSGVGPMILVSIGPDLPASTRAAPYVYVLDMNPGTTTLNDAGLTAGKSYSDPSGGFTVTVDAINNASASVTVTTTGTGALTCGDNSTFEAPGPDASSCGPLFGGGSPSGGAGSGGARGATGGAGGATGSGGRGGTAGAAGKSGASGSGTGGSSGTQTGGISGTSTGGSAGSGRGGATGGATGGTTATGTGGTGATAAGGTGLVTGAAGNRSTGGEESGGCSCDTAPGGPPIRTTTLAPLVALIAFARRRPTRAPVD